MLFITPSCSAYFFTLRLSGLPVRRFSAPSSLPLSAGPSNLMNLNQIGGITVFDSKSNYALNKKDPDSIVYNGIDGGMVRIKKEDFSSEEE